MLYEFLMYEQRLGNALMKDITVTKFGFLFFVFVYNFYSRHYVSLKRKSCADVEGR